MKTILAVFLLAIVCLGCHGTRRPDTHDTDVTVWITQRDHGPQYDIARLPLSVDSLTEVLRKCQRDVPGFRLVVITDPAVSVTNMLPLLSMADEIGIKNIEVKLKQERPKPESISTKL